MKAIAPPLRIIPPRSRHSLSSRIVLVSPAIMLHGCHLAAYHQCRGYLVECLMRTMAFRIRPHAMTSTLTKSKLEIILCRNHALDGSPSTPSITTPDSIAQSNQSRLKRFLASLSTSHRTSFCSLQYSRSGGDPACHSSEESDGVWRDQPLL